MTSSIPPVRRPALPRAIAILLLLFLAAYIPAFAIAGGLHLPLERTVPVVMLVSVAIASVMIGVIIRRSRLDAVTFGFCWPPIRYLGWSLLFAVPLSAAIAWMLAHASEPGPLAGLSLAPWQVYLYFAVGAPIQEEVIFRGLLQTTLAWNLAVTPQFVATSSTAVAAALAVALLFGVIHLMVGPLTALGALVLGVLAGELRRRSGSLVPAVICHSIFNLGGILWALA